jgi:hypothetical protein
MLWVNVEFLWKQSYKIDNTSTWIWWPKYHKGYCCGWHNFLKWWKYFSKFPKKMSCNFPEFIHFTLLAYSMYFRTFKNTIYLYIRLDSILALDILNKFCLYQCMSEHRFGDSTITKGIRMGDIIFWNDEYIIIQYSVTSECWAPKLLKTYEGYRTKHTLTLIIPTLMFPYLLNYCTFLCIWSRQEVPKEQVCGLFTTQLVLYKFK